MRIQISGRHMDVGDALRQRIAEELQETISKYFSRPAEAFVSVSREASGFSVDCAIHLSSGIHLQAEGAAQDAHAAFDAALGRVEKQIRRYKNRLKDHHAGDRTFHAPDSVAAFVLAPLKEDVMETEGEAGDWAAREHEHNGDAPLVIAETSADLQTLTVSAAVLQLEIAHANALLFRNAANDGLNLVYRRQDGNIGWIDPSRPASRAPSSVGGLDREQFG